MLDKFIRFLRSTPNGGLFLVVWAFHCNIAWLFLAAAYGGIRWSNVDHPTYAITNASPEQTDVERGWERVFNSLFLKEHFL